MEMKWVKILVSGSSPEIGVHTKGKLMNISKKVADIFILRNMAEEAEDPDSSNEGTEPEDDVSATKPRASSEAQRKKSEGSVKEEKDKKAKVKEDEANG